METSARLEVNIEETFALIVRRVVEARRLAERGLMENTNLNARGMTKPLTPLPSHGEDGNEKREVGTRGPNLDGGKLGKGPGGFWKSLRCW